MAGHRPTLNIDSVRLITESVPCEGHTRLTKQTPNAPTQLTGRRFQSARNAAFGSTRDARNAGTQLAITATASSVTITPTITGGSFGDTLNKSGATHRLAM